MKRKICQAVYGAGLVLALVLPMRAQAPSANPEEDAIRKLIATFAIARNAHDGATAARLYGEDGEWIAYQGVRTVRGRAALTALWGTALGQVTRTVQGIDVPSDSVAIVRVRTDYGQPIGIHREVFVVVKEQGTWRIRVHQTAD